MQPEIVEYIGTTQPTTGGYAVPQWMHQYGYTVPEYKPIPSNDSFSHSVYAAVVSAFSGSCILETFSGFICLTDHTYS